MQRMRREGVEVTPGLVPWRGERRSGTGIVPSDNRTVTAESRPWSSIGAKDERQRRPGDPDRLEPAGGTSGGQQSNNCLRHAPLAIRFSTPSPRHAADYGRDTYTTPRGLARALQPAAASGTLDPRRQPAVPTSLCGMRLCVCGCKSADGVCSRPVA